MGNNTEGNIRHDGYRDGNGSNGLHNSNIDGRRHGDAMATTLLAMEGTTVTAVMVSVTAMGDSNGNSGNGLRDCDGNGRHNATAMAATALEGTTTTAAMVSMTAMGVMVSALNQGRTDRRNDDNNNGNGQRDGNINTISGDRLHDRNGNRRHDVDMLATMMTLLAMKGSTVTAKAAMVGVTPSGDSLGWQCRDLCLSATPPKQQTFVSVTNMSTMSGRQVGNILLSQPIFCRQNCVGELYP